MAEYKTQIKKFGDEEIEVLYRKTRRPVTPEEYDEAKRDEMGLTDAFNQRTYAPQPGIICEQDVGVKMRDGVTIYADIYRPEGQTGIPVLLSWSPYGKRPGYVQADWNIMGVPPGTVSKMAKFESPDPAYWCCQGYAVANVDPRGIGHSEGEANLFGTQDGQDGYDFIEWVAQQDWCNGNVGMGGNSAVAMTQWRIAAQQPPHLKCIAPWEGTTDIYGESVYEGGVPGLRFNEQIMWETIGTSYADDIAAMGRKYPLMNAYWRDKIPDFKKITCPTYTCVCWHHFHLRGTMNAFRWIRTPRKWLRAHREFEWPDAYSSHNLADLQRFYDRYLKEIRNGWELTPRIRLEVTDAFEYDYQTNRPEKEFPLARTDYKKLYIDAKNKAMQDKPAAEASHISYEGATEEVCFDYRFEEDTELTGYMKLRLYVEAQGHDDMDLFINVQKLDEDGEFLPITILGEPHPGTWGKMRVSHRELDQKRSTDYQPIQAHTREQKLKPGEIVCVDIELNPICRLWHAGQQIRVQVAGRYIRDENWFEPLGWEPENIGKHVIHSGGEYESFLQVPTIPPRYKAKNYIYR